MRWLETLAGGIFVYEVTGSALLVATIMMVRQLPLALFGSFIGPIAERGRRKILLVTAMSMMAISTLTLAGLAWFGVIEIWHIIIGSFVNGMAWATDYPVRRTMVGDFAGRDRLGAGISLDSATNNATRMVGPFAGGFLYQFIGLDGAYLVAGSAHAVSALIALSLIYAEHQNRIQKEPYLKMLREGIALVRGSPKLIGVFVVTIILNVFGFPYASMVPVLGRDRFEVEPTFVGLLSASEGAGAFIGALIIAFIVRPNWYMRLYVWGAGILIFGVFCFSLTDSYAVGVSILMLAGFGMAGFGAMQSTLVLISVPPEARSRVMGLLSVCIGAAPIGLLHVGLLADHLGAHVALTIIAIEGLVLLALCVFLIPSLRR